VCVSSRQPRGQPFCTWRSDSILFSRQLLSRRASGISSNMPSATDLFGSPGAITREMLFDLMVLARDTSFPDAQIRVICDTVTQDNINGNVELLRRKHASQNTSLVLVSTPSPPQSVTSVQSKPYARLLNKTSSEPGAVLCADTFYRLCNDERNKLKRLSVFCPFALSFRRCPHSDRCQLIHICWVRFIAFGSEISANVALGGPLQARTHLHVLSRSYSHLRSSFQWNTLYQD
jgi:hypothetical protein